MTRSEPDPEALLARGSSEHYADTNYYDYTYRRRTEDVTYYRMLARKHGGPVLELGVGTGRIALPIAEDGFEVIGIDASAPMLRRAEEKARALGISPDKLTLREGDMRRFQLRRRFPLVIAPFNALLHLYEPDDLVSCFRCVKRHLAPDGRFVFDIRVPDPAELARDPEREYVGRPFVHPTLGTKVRYTEQFRYDPIKQVQYVTIRFDPEKRGVPPVETLLSQRQIFPAELRALLTAGGLRLAGRHGDFSGRPLSDADPLAVVTAAHALPRRR